MEAIGFIMAIGWYVSGLVGSQTLCNKGHTLSLGGYLWGGMWGPIWLLWGQLAPDYTKQTPAPAERAPRSDFSPAHPGSVRYWATKPEQLEWELHAATVPFLQHVFGSEAEANKTFADMLRRAKDDARNEVTENLPLNYGDLLVEREQMDDRIRAALAGRRREGVTDEDIRSWWNRPDIARRVSRQVDEMLMDGVYLQYRRKGMLPDEAAREVFRIFVRYGDPDDTSLASGEDRPLPIELQWRITTCLEQWRTVPETYRQEVSQATSLNAWIRKNLHLGGAP